MPKKKIYLLNPKTGCIHILGFCRLATSCPKEWLKFESEDDARAARGAQSAHLCKNCLKTRENEI